MILPHTMAPHALRSLGNHPFIRNPQDGIPPVAIPVFGFHVVALHGPEMTPPGLRPDELVPCNIDAYTAPCMGRHAAGVVHPEG